MQVCMRCMRCCRTACDTCRPVRCLGDCWCAFLCQMSSASKLVCNQKSRMRPVKISNQAPAAALHETPHVACQATSNHVCGPLDVDVIDLERLSHALCATHACTCQRPNAQAALCLISSSQSKSVCVRGCHLGVHR